LEIAELLFFPRALTAQDRQYYQAFYTAKFGLQNAAPVPLIQNTVLSTVTSFPHSIDLPSSIDDGAPIGSSVTDTFSVAATTYSKPIDLWDHDGNSATPPKLRFSGYGACDVTVTSTDGVHSSTATARYLIRPPNQYVWITVDNSGSMSGVAQTLDDTIAEIKNTIGPLLYDDPNVWNARILLNKKQDERWLYFAAGLYSASPAVGMNAVVGPNASVVSLVYCDENYDNEYMGGPMTGYHPAVTDNGPPTSLYIDDYNQTVSAFANGKFGRGIIYGVQTGSLGNPGFLDHLEKAIVKSRQGLAPYNNYPMSPKISYKTIQSTRPAADYVKDILEAIGYAAQ
jgi:hypothetical protein